jgi:hypothetical protein
MLSVGCSSGGPTAPRAGSSLCSSLRQKPRPEVAAHLAPLRPSLDAVVGPCFIGFTTEAQRHGAGRTRRLANAASPLRGLPPFARRFAGGGRGVGIRPPPSPIIARENGGLVPRPRGTDRRCRASVPFFPGRRSLPAKAAPCLGVSVVSLLSLRRWMLDVLQVARPLRGRALLWCFSPHSTPYQAVSNFAQRVSKLDKTKPNRITAGHEGRSQEDVPTRDSQRH